MSRLVWILVAAAFALLLWVGRDASAPAASGGGGSSPTSACVLPPLPFGTAPLQTDVPRGMQPFRQGSFVLSPLAAFSVEARVLSREDYLFGTETELSPTDLALGWGRMADPAVYEPLSISQDSRWYRYRWGGRGPPIPVPEIVGSSANMHMIPADASVEAALERVRPGQMVRLRGWLVQTRRDDGWTWRSSLSRTDSGDGACELVYVCALDSY